MSILKYNQWLNIDGTENYKCRAWVNFNGTGTVAIRASGNVSSITDNGTGDYTVNFTTPMVDANYSVSYSAGGTSNSTVYRIADDTTPRTSNLFRLYTTSNSWSLLDVVQVNVSVFR